MSPSVIVNIVQASDLLLLLFCGLLSTSVLTPLRGLRFEGSLFLITATASFVTAAFLARAHAYLLSSLCSLGKQLKLLPVPLLAGCGSMIVCLFLMRDDSLFVSRMAFSLAMSRAPSCWSRGDAIYHACYTAGAILAGWPAGLQ